MGAFDDLIPAAPKAPAAPVGGLFGDLVPPESMRAVRAVVQDNLRRRKTYDFTESFLAGLENSVPALAVGKPKSELAEDPTVGGRIGFQAGQLLGDFPLMVAGAVMGAGVGTAATPGPGTVIGGMAGGFGLPAGLRATLMDAYEKGEFKSFGDFWDRASHIIWETVKGQATGAATGLAGVGTAAKVGSSTLMVANPAARLTQAVAPTAAEIATMTTVGAALEGRVPSAQEFLDGAILVGGLKGANKVAGKLREIYRETGMGPTEVVVAARQRPELQAEIMDAKTGELPPALKEIAAQERVRAAVPDRMTDEAHALKLAEVIKNPYAEVPVDKVPNHINYRYVEAPGDVKAIQAKIAEQFEQQTQAARGTETWEQTATKADVLLREAARGGDKEAAELIAQADRAGVSPLDVPGNLAARIMAKVAMDQRSAFDVRLAAEEVARATTPEAKAEAARAMERAIEVSAVVHAETQGNVAEVARSLNVIKASKQTADLVKTIGELQAKYGKDPDLLAKMILELDNPRAINEFARLAAKATTFEKLIEAWKAGLLSGPYTHAANLLGNFTFMAMRPLVDSVAVAMGPFTKGSERVSIAEPFARIAGNFQAIPEAARLAVATFKAGSDLAKAEQYRTAIEGTKGEIIRTPFKLLSASDAFFRTLNERGEANTLAIRQAISEGLNIQTREFRERVAEILQNPDAKMVEQIKNAGERFTFNKELGPGGQKIQGLVKEFPVLQLIAPFIRTPINIAKELARSTPLAPLLGEWRADFMKGGASQAKAMAELTIGSSLMGVTAALALDGKITGQPDPDPGKRRVQLASGWQPYSVKIGDTYYSYQRVQPVGTLMGLAADMAMVWDHMSDEEQDKLPKMLSVAFANAVTNQTFLQGVTQFVQAAADPTRYGQRLVQGYAGSIVPAISGQTAAMMDPLQREVNTSLEAIKSRVPGVREDLLAKRDAFGEPIAAKEKAGFVFPIAISQKSDDPVRLEAARLGLSVAPPPKKMHVGRGTGKIGDVKLTPEQTDKFEEVSGKLAHDIMTNVISMPQWKTMPDIAKRKAFQRAELISHKAGAAAALPPELRIEVMQQIADKIAIESAKVSK